MNTQFVIAGVHQRGYASDPENTYHYLMSCRSGHVNDHALASMLVSQMACNCDLPDNLGLSVVDFREMMAFHFPSATWPVCDDAGYGESHDSGEEEKQLLFDLLWSHRVDSSKARRWIAVIVAAGCMGSDHLWQDMGLPCRADLSTLLRTNFPLLVQKNIHDMKWKRFFYRQLCEQRGFTVCRSPNCEACVDYNLCFGEDD